MLPVNVTCSLLVDRVLTAGIPQDIPLMINIVSILTATGTLVKLTDAIVNQTSSNTAVFVTSQILTATVEDNVMIEITPTRLPTACRHCFALSHISLIWFELWIITHLGASRYQLISDEYRGTGLHSEAALWWSLTTYWICSPYKVWCDTFLLSLWYRDHRNFSNLCKLKHHPSLPPGQAGNPLGRFVGRPCLPRNSSLSSLLDR